MTTLLALLCAHAPLAQAAPLLLDDSARQFPLQGHLEAWFDETGVLTQQDVSSAHYTQRFEPLPGNFNGGFRRKGAWWLRFAIQAEPGSGDDWWLHLGAPYVDRIDVWLPERTDAGIVLRHRALGGERPVSARDMPWSVPALRLSALPQGEPQWVWIRLAGERSIGLLGNVWKLDAMTGAFQSVTVRVAAVVGMTLMMAIVCLMLGVSLPDAKFRWYSAYLAVTALLFMCSENLLSTLLLPEHPLLALRIHHVAVWLGLLASVAFAYSLLEMREQFPRTGVAFQVLAALSIAGIGISLAGHYGLTAPAANLMRLLLAVVIIALCVVLVRRSHPGAWPVFIGYSVYGAVGMLHFAKNLDLLPFTRFTQYSYLIGVVVHMLAIFLSLGLRVRARERQALADSLEAGVRLEANVAARTAELRTEIRERQRIETQLQAATQSKSEFLANMSHEIRTPLNAILGTAELLGDTGLDREQRESLKTIQQSGDHLLGVIDDILDFSKVEAGMLELEDEVFGLRRTVAEALELVAHRAAHKRLDLACAFTPGTPEMARGDAGRVRQILVNYLSNAIKFTEAGDVSVEVSAQPLDGGRHRFRIAVRDTGIGIPPDRLNRLFKSFSQVDASTTRRYGGSGLGLAISSRLAERMGGGVDVQSCEGEGSEFSFTFVAATDPANVLPSANDKTAGHSFPRATDAQALRILLAEDNATNRQVGTRMLESLGYRADVVENGAEAVEAVRAKPYDLVLMDIHMPEMDGLEATRRIRAMTDIAQPRIYAMTASVLDDERQACIDAGMDRHLAKPFRRRELEQVLAEVAGAVGVRA